MARFGNLLEKLYPEAQAKNAVQRENLRKTAVISFTPDAISLSLMADMKKAAQECRPLTYENLLELAKSADRKSVV